VTVEQMVPHRYRVGWRRRDTVDTVTFGLDPIDGPLPPFAPGQFAMLYAFGVGEVPISVSATPPEGQLVHTIRDVGPVSHALCGASEAEMVGVRGPFGTSWAAEDAAGRDLVILAGGVGLAPLRPVIDQVLADRDRFGMVCLLAGARSPDALLFRDEFDAWSEHLDVQMIVDHAEPTWPGRIGVVTELLETARFDAESALSLVCGPEVMMRFAARSLLNAGVTADRIRISMERNMKCAIGHCGHCQFGAEFVCKDGPVFTYADVEPLLRVREV
jgi:anaerobic sulfite reductase subunit B